jgi:tryptophanyl-tRNA synthetase
MADLNKMTQFKDKAGKNQESVSIGLYDYPVLMAADILLYDTDIVPVGEDQKQHVELARDIARRFNTEFSDTFKIPQSIVRKEGARIMSLLDPSKKMSKSEENQNNCINLLDDIEVAKKKIMRAMTDSGSEIVYDPEDKPAIANLLTIYAQLGGRQIPRLVKDYSGKGYGDFKKDLAEVVAKFLEDFQKKYNKISDNDVKKVLEEGREKVEKMANEKMEKVRKLIGVR